MPDLSMLRYRAEMTEWRCRRHRPRCRCPAMFKSGATVLLAACSIQYLPQQCPRRSRPCRTTRSLKILIKNDDISAYSSPWAQICRPFKEPRESIPSLAGRYDNPIWRTGPPGYIGWRKSIPGLLQRLQIRASSCVILPLPQEYLK